jgi:hypothetical protein
MAHTNNRPELRTVRLIAAEELPTYRNKTLRWTFLDADTGALYRATCALDSATTTVWANALEKRYWRLNLPARQHKDCTAHALIDADGNLRYLFPQLDWQQEDPDALIGQLFSALDALLHCVGTEAYTAECEPVQRFAGIMTELLGEVWNTAAQLCNLLHHMPCPIPSFELEDADSEGDNLLTTTHTEED